MKVVTFHAMDKNLYKKINEWIDTECEENTLNIFTINLPHWIIQYIHKEQYINRTIESRSAFMRYIINKYLEYIKVLFNDYVCVKCQKKLRYEKNPCIHIPKLAPSRSEFIRHAFMWYYYNRNEGKKENKDTSKKGLPIINGKEIVLIRRLD